MIKCWHYRRIISSSVDTNAVLSPPAQRHIQSCPACRAHYESESKIVRQLSAGAGAQRQSPSPFLHARIMSSIANSPTVTTQRIQMPGWMRRAVALGSVCVLLTVILWLRHRPSSDGSVSLASNGASVLSQPTLPLKLPDAWQFREWTTKLDEPLEHEMQLVVNDAKTAMNSLVDNFLPGKLRSSLFERVHD